MLSVFWVLFSPAETSNTLRHTNESTEQSSGWMSLATLIVHGWGKRFLGFPFFGSCGFEVAGARDALLRSSFLSYGYGIFSGNNLRAIFIGVNLRKLSSKKENFGKKPNPQTKHNAGAPGA